MLIILWNDEHLRKQYYYIDSRIKNTEAESACEAYLSNSKFILT